MRKEEKTRLRREMIIAVALREFAVKGYKGFVINELCKIDGISKGVLYHNFSGKSDLYLTCVQESFEKALAMFMGEDGQVPSLADYMERCHQFYQQYPEHSHIFFEAMIATPEELAAEIVPQKAVFLDLNEQVCQKLLSEFKLKDHIDEKRAMAYLRLIQDMFLSYYLTVSSDSSLTNLVAGYEHQLSQVLDMMIYGIIGSGKELV
ncbi:TPA: TetR/AcrR family transcriptional regulator [Streptococcus suis]